MARRRPTAAQVRDRRAKRLVLALGVVFLGVAGIQGPKLMKQLHHSPPPVNNGVPSTTSPPTATTASAPAGAGPTTTAATTPAPAPVPASSSGTPAGVLTSFALLPLKDPFHAPIQATSPSGGAVGADETSSGGGDADAESAASSAKEGSSDNETAVAAVAPRAAAPTTAIPAWSKPPTPATTPKAPVKAKPTPPAPAVKFVAAPPNGAVIAMNGRAEIVTVGAGFPSTEPMFKLVSLARDKHGIRISVVGGSFAGGLPTLLLAKGRKITLADQSDGTRYVLELVNLTNQAPPLPPPTTGKTAASASAPATTAPQTTTTTPSG